MKNGTLTPDFASACDARCPPRRLTWSLQHEKFTTMMASASAAVEWEKWGVQMFLTGVQLRKMGSPNGFGLRRIVWRPPVNQRRGYGKSHGVFTHGIILVRFPCQITGRYRRKHLLGSANLHACHPASVRSRSTKTE